MYVDVHTSRGQSNRQIRKGTHAKGTHRSDGGGRSYLVSFNDVKAKAVVEVVHTSWIVGVIADARRTRICDNGRVDLWNSTSKPQLKDSFSLSSSFSLILLSLLFFLFPHPESTRERVFDKGQNAPR